MELCLKKERDYNDMRTNMPVYFSDATDFIDKLESKNFCEIVYGDSYKELVPLCKTSLNGILNKGLSNAFYYMFTQILKQNLNYNALGVTGNRTTSELKKMIANLDII